MDDELDATLDPVALAVRRRFLPERAGELVEGNGELVGAGGGNIVLLCRETCDGVVEDILVQEIESSDVEQVLL